MNLNDVMDELGTRLDTITGLRVFPYPTDQLTPNAAVLGWPEFTYDLTYARGYDSYDLPIWVVVGRMSDRSARRKLAPYISGSGGQSVKAVLEGGTYTAFDTIRVVGGAVEPFTIEATEYFAARFDCDIAGPGG